MTSSSPEKFSEKNPIDLNGDDMMVLNHNNSLTRKKKPIRANYTPYTVFPPNEMMNKSQQVPNQSQVNIELNSADIGTLNRKTIQKPIGYDFEMQNCFNQTNQGGFVQTDNPVMMVDGEYGFGDNNWTTNTDNKNSIDVNTSTSYVPFMNQTYYCLVPNKNPANVQFTTPTTTGSEETEKQTNSAQTYREMSV